METRPSAGFGTDDGAAQTIAKSFEQIFLIPFERKKIKNGEGNVAIEFLHCFVFAFVFDLFSLRFV